MPLKDSWVDHLFAKLTIRYGAAFMRQWPDANPAHVKADWAEVLDGFDGDALSYALRYLPTTPPNALQFRDLCRRSPAPTHIPRIANDVKADPERVRELVAMVKGSLGYRTEAHKAMKSLARAVEERGGKMSMPQRAQFEALRRVLGDEVSA